MDRYLVYGYYTDEPQVVVDCVDADSDEQAIEKVAYARGGSGSDYTSDGAARLSEVIENLTKLAALSPEQVEREHAELAAEYAHYHEDG